MPYVWYIGSANVKELRGNSWPGGYVRWYLGNGWAVDQSIFTENQLSVLDADSSFLLNQEENARQRPAIPDGTNAGSEAEYWYVKAYQLWIETKEALESGEFVGVKGDKGDKGDQGDPGPQGIPGVKGDKGDTGAKGDKGDKGDTGDVGPQGLKGDPGTTGATGAQGPKGDTGDVGPQGLKGDRGDQGVKGDTGLQGAQGVKGDKGDKGDTGSQGEEGPQGPQGERGLQGEPGTVGPKGDKGDKGDQGEGINPDGSVQNYGDLPTSGMTEGSQYLVISSGKLYIFTGGAWPAEGDGIVLRGPKGDKGDKGDTGDTGPQGPQGVKGDQGIPGTQGNQGVKGDKGDPGRSVSSITEDSDHYTFHMSDSTTESVPSPSLDGKLDANASPGQVYATDWSGNPSPMDYNSGSWPDFSFVQRDVDGVIRGGTPLDGNDLTTKNYVDSALLRKFSVITPESYGAVGDGVTDDKTALQNAINALPAGGALMLSPNKTYAISGTIYLAPRRRYFSPGGANGSGSVIKVKAGGTWSGPMLAALVYGSTSQTVCDDPVYIEGITLDGNKANVTGTNIGILLINYWSKITDVYIKNLLGAAIKLTDKRADGTNISNSCSENAIRQCKIDTVGTAILQESNNGLSNQDGFCEDVLISNVTTGLSFARAAGWSFRRLHLYGVQQSGLDLKQCYATEVYGVYVEDFGSVAGWWAGIQLTQLNGRQSSVIGCHVTVPTSANANRNAAFQLNPGSAQTTAAIVYVANSILGVDASNCYGLYGERGGGDTTGLLAIRRAAISVVGVNSARQESVGTGISVVGDYDSAIATAQTIAITSVTGTTYTLVLADQNKAIEGNNASAQTFTVPANSSVAFPIGTVIEIVQLGAGSITLSPASGVTINGTLVTSGQYKALVLRKRATDTWIAY